MENSGHFDESTDLSVNRDALDKPVQATPRAKRTPSNKYKSFEEAKAFAQSLSLKSRKEWREYVKGQYSNLPAKPEDVPAHPDGIYKTRGWQGWRHWLGTEKPRKENFN